MSENDLARSQSRVQALSRQCEDLQSALSALREENKSLKQEMDRRTFAAGSIAIENRFEISGMRNRAQAAEAECARYRSMLQIDQPWPLIQVLKRLADATDHLLKDHDCDQHGHEGDRYAEQAARTIITRMEDSVEVVL